MLVELQIGDAEALGEGALLLEPRPIVFLEDFALRGVPLRVLFSISLIPPLDSPNAEVPERAEQERDQTAEHDDGGRRGERSLVPGPPRLEEILFGAEHRVEHA